MKLTVDIDKYSGFCAGVIRAISKAEDQLDKFGKLYSLGSIVHNDTELKRLGLKGLVTIDIEDLKDITKSNGESLLIRAHGEPPSTYETAERLGLHIIDCTCPVVLRLQKSILESWTRMHRNGKEGQIIIFGKPGHAEVLGLVGQVSGDAIVIENLENLCVAIDEGKIRLDIPTEIFSQTTKNPVEYLSLCSKVEELMAQANGTDVEDFKKSRMLVVHNTICSQVASRHSRLSAFATEHDVVIFVCGKASSNGKVLCDLCRSVNIRTYNINSPDELRKEWFRDDESVGVCGATSTPKWLLQDVAEKILEYNINNN